MSIKEILEELPKLTPEERQELRRGPLGRERLQPFNGAMEEAKELIHKCALRSASALKQGKI